jgi:hypothetical protein
MPWIFLSPCQKLFAGFSTETIPIPEHGESIQRAYLSEETDTVNSRFRRHLYGPNHSLKRQLIQGAVITTMTGKHATLRGYPVIRPR